MMTVNGLIIGSGEHDVCLWVYKSQAFVLLITNVDGMETFIGLQSTDGGCLCDPVLVAESDPIFMVYKSQPVVSACPNDHVSQCQS